MAIGLVGSVLQSFGPTTESSGTGSGSGGIPPPSPVLSVSLGDDGEAVFTISGGASGATNTLYLMEPEGETWVEYSGRMGNGTITETLYAGRWFAYVESELEGVSLSNVIVFRVVGESDAELGHSPAYVLRTLLIELGVGVEPIIGNTTTAWQAFTSNEPDLPDNCITTTDTAGRLDGRLAISGETVEHYGVQIKIRSSDFHVGWRKANEISTVLDEAVYDETLVIDSAQYQIHAVTKSGGIANLGRDRPNGNRSLFTLNVTIDIQRIS